MSRIRPYAFPTPAGPRSEFPKETSAFGNPILRLLLLTCRRRLQAEEERSAREPMGRNAEPRRGRAGVSSMSDWRAAKAPDALGVAEV